MSSRNDDSFAWPEFYREFDYFSEHLVRPGCQPRRYLHSEPVEKAIVLVHGLSDSPYYMTALADYFYYRLGYNVYLPLLHCHGLKNPEGMAGVKLSEWKKNVRFALQKATESADRISIGGLSTGGALGFYLACLEPEVEGDIYLFSAALGFGPGRFGLPGKVRQLLIRSPLFYLGQLVESRAPLVAHKPYRYSRLPLSSARELAFLIKEIDRLLKDGAWKKRDKCIFAAWSEFDRVIDIPKLMGLKEYVGPGQFSSFVIGKAAKLQHACVVLQEPIFASNRQPGDSPQEKANPSFAKMLGSLHQFELSC